MEQLVRQITEKCYQLPEADQKDVLGFVEHLIELRRLTAESKQARALQEIRKGLQEDLAF